MAAGKPTPIYSAPFEIGGHTCRFVQNADEVVGACGTPWSMQVKETGRNYWHFMTSAQMVEFLVFDKIVTCELEFT